MERRPEREREREGRERGGEEEQNIQLSIADSKQRSAVVGHYDTSGRMTVD